MVTVAEEVMEEAVVTVSRKAMVAVAMVGVAGGVVLTVALVQMGLEEGHMEAREVHLHPIVLHLVVMEVSIQIHPILLWVQNHLLSLLELVMQIHLQVAMVQHLVMVSHLLPVEATVLQMHTQGLIALVIMAQCLHLLVLDLEVVLAMTVMVLELVVGTQMRGQIQ